MKDAPAAEARVPYSVLRVRKTGTSFVPEGQPAHTIRLDPVRVEPSAPVTYSLQAGWSFANDRLTVLADRLGLIPLYYRVGDHEIVVSDSITALAGHSPGLEIDLFEVYVFLKLGVYLGTATPFHGVHRMRPAETIVWENGRFTRSEPPADVRPYSGTREEAIAEANRLFAAAVRKRVHDDLQPIVPLTGGRDSRHILLELARHRAQGLQAVTVEYMRDYQEDIRVASLLASAVSVPHRVLTHDYRHYFRHMREQTVRNQFESELHQWTQAITAYASGQECLLFDGLGGDGLLNSAYARVLPDGMYESVRSGDIERMADMFAVDYDPPSHLRRLPDARSFAERLKSRLISEIARHKDAPDVMCRFMFEHRTRRATGIGPIGTLGRLAQVSLPYLEQDLVDFAYRLPAAEYWQPGFHDEMIARHYPEYAYIPFERGELRGRAKVAWQRQLWLIFGCIPVLIRALGASIVMRAHTIGGFVYNSLRGRVFRWLYVAESDAYFQTLRRHASARRKKPS